MTGPAESAHPHQGIVDRQLAPEWVAWVARKDELLGVFFERDVPQMPADRYSSIGLDVAEQALLARVTCRGTAVDAAALHRFGCYLGEVFVQSLQGFWINAPLTIGVRPAVRFVYTEIRISVQAQVYLAVRLRTGQHWSDLHATVSEYCAEWWQTGQGNLD